jgi:hypothetical protein
MHLEHNFSNETRHLFLYHQYCWKCGSNGNERGGLSIHHICNRKKHEKYLDSPFNASVLCGVCHEAVTHSDEERLELFMFTLKVLKTELYKPVKTDILFIYEHAEDKFHKTPEYLIQECILKV